MFNKYQKTYRIQTPNIEVSGKMNKMFSGY